MNITGFKNPIAPVDASAKMQIQVPAVSLISERQAAVTGGKQQPPPADVVDLQQELVDAAEIISDLVQNLNLDSDLQFQVDDSTGANIITVLDGETGEVIRRFPSEESMAIARYIAEFAEAPRVGLLMDQTE